MTSRWRETHARAVSLAKHSYGVTGRRQLENAGITPADIRTHVNAGRWQRLGEHSFRPPSDAWCPERSPIAIAVHESRGHGWADASSALILAGLTNWRSPVVVGVGHSTQRMHLGVGVRRLYVWNHPDLQGSGVPYAAPAWAALRAAAIARSDREAGTVLSMTVQRRLATPDQFWAALERLPKLHRRKLIRELLGDITTGSESIGELDFIRMCRRRGIPAPDRQVVRRHRNGTYYLDARWGKARLTVEIDGAHHYLGDNPTADALRQNTVSMSGDVVLRIPVIALRTTPDPFFDQIVARLREFGVM